MLDTQWESPIQVGSFVWETLYSQLTAPFVPHTKHDMRLSLRPGPRSRSWAIMPPRAPSTPPGHLPSSAADAYIYRRRPCALIPARALNWLALAGGPRSVASGAHRGGVGVTASQARFLVYNYENTPSF
jgi:hypothetical protein